jgi:hypothetical protein
LWRVWARLGQIDDEGGSGWGTSPASGVPEATGCQRLQDPAQKNQGKEGRLTKGSGWPELPRKGEDDDDRRQRGSGARGEGCCRDSPCSGSPWFDVWGSCEGARGIRGVRGSSTTKNRGCGASHRRRLRLQFRHEQGSGIDGEALNSSLMTRWSYRSSWLELGVTGAMDSRRSRGGGMRRCGDSARAGR